MQEVIDLLFNTETIDAWISGLGSFLGALLAGIVTAGIAIWIMRRQIKDSDKKSLANYEKGKQMIENFVDLAISSLLLIIPGPNEDYVPDKNHLIAEFKKLKHVNDVLESIPYEQVDIKYNVEFQNIKILLRILEIEIERVVKSLYEESGIANYNKSIKSIEIDRRLKKIMEHLLKISNNQIFVGLYNDLDKISK